MKVIVIALAILVASQASAATPKHIQQRNVKELNTYVQLQVESLKTRISNLESTVAELIAILRKSVPRQASGRNVEQEIAAQARKDWPGDYRMQKYQIQSQTEAYRELHGTR